MSSEATDVYSGVTSPPGGGTCSVVPSPEPLGRCASYDGFRGAGAHDSRVRRETHAIQPMHAQFNPCTRSHATLICAAVTSGAGKILNY